MSRRLVLLQLSIFFLLFSPFFFASIWAFSVCFAFSAFPYGCPFPLELTLFLLSCRYIQIFSRAASPHFFFAYLMKLFIFLAVCVRKRGWARKMCLCCPTAIYPLDSIAAHRHLPAPQRLCGVHNGCLLFNHPNSPRGTRSLRFPGYMKFGFPSVFLAIFIHFEVCCHCHPRRLLLLPGEFHLTYSGQGFFALWLKVSWLIQRRFKKLLGVIRL